MARLVDIGSIGSYFESLDDPRHTRNRKHLLVDIAVCAITILGGPLAGHDAEDQPVIHVQGDVGPVIPLVVVGRIIRAGCPRARRIVPCRPGSGAFAWPCRGRSDGRR